MIAHHHTELREELQQPLPLAEEAILEYQNNGWLHISQLIPSQTVEQLRTLTSDDSTPECERDNTVVKRVAGSPRVVSVAKQLLGTARVQVFRASMRRVPARTQTQAKTYPHQDLAYLPFDRAGSLMIWIALDAAPPGHPETYVTSSHRKYPLLGRIYARDEERIGRILHGAEHVGPAKTLPGDATAYDCMTVHQVHQGDNPHDALLVFYIRPDVLYTGANYYVTDDRGLVINEPFPESLFPAY